MSIAEQLMFFWFDVFKQSMREGKSAEVAADDADLGLARVTKSILKKDAE